MELRVGTRILVDMTATGLVEPDPFESVTGTVQKIGLNGYLLVSGSGGAFKKGNVWVAPRRVTGLADEDEPDEKPKKAKAVKR